MKLIALLSSFAVTALLVGCSSGTTSTAGGDAAPASTSAASALGPKCEIYYGTCCAELANTLPAGANRDSAVKACSDANANIKQGIAAGATAEQYESACAQGITSAQAAGKCK
jgi:uncharacterized protein YceK